MKNHLILTLLLSLLLMSCVTMKLIDADATRETKALYTNLENSLKNIPFLVTNMLLSMAVAG